MKKHTQKTLLLSITALIVCVALLAGTTMAWFTDSVSSGVNTITAGNLDIELEYSKDGRSWNPVQDATELIDRTALWEPGHTEVVYLRLSNKGTLALKYRFGMNISDETTGTNVAGETFNLSTHLKYGLVEGGSTFADRNAARTAAEAVARPLTTYDEVGTMAVNATRQFALVVYMPEGVGNEANYKTGTTAPKIELGLNLIATQLASENDSFDNQYDGGANYEGDLMQSASAVVTAPAVNGKLEIVLNNNAPVSDEKSTTLTMENIPDTLAGKEVQFSATTYNASATQNEPNFRIATGDNTEVAALKLELTVDGQNANEIDNTARTVTTYIETGLSDVKVTYVPETGTPVEIPDVTYESATGKLTFTTTHFSDYVVTAKALAETDGVYEIKNVDDLFAFARLVNVKANAFSGKTVKLMADIDLDGKTWVPVGQTGGYTAKTYFQGTFDGNGKTISNLTIPATTWEAGSDNGTNFATGFFGFIDQGGQTIKNVTFENAKVEGHHWVGVAAGYMTGTVSGVKVTNSTITSTYKNGEADGDKAGGVVGYLNSNSSVTGCTVTGSKITAVRDCGSVVGHSAGISITGNTAENCMVYYSTDNDEQIGGEIAGKRASGVSENTATNVTVCKKVNVSNATELSSALAPIAEGHVKEIHLSGNIALTAPITINGDVEVIGDGNSVISAYPVSVATTANVSFKNVNFATPDNEKHNASSVYASGLEGKVVFDGCTFTNPQWECIQITPKDGAEVVVTNCTFVVDGNGTYAKANGAKVERMLHIQNTDATGQYTAVITNNRFVGVDLCYNAVIDVDDIAAFANVTCGGNTFANHDGTSVSTMDDGMIYVNINGTAYVATNTYAQFTQTPAAKLQH